MSTLGSLDAHLSFHAMTRTFKFSFPVPSRKQHHEPIPTSLYDASGSPLFNPGSKAERVLGTSEASVKGARKLSFGKEKKVHQPPSYMSVTILETEGGSLKAGSSNMSRPSHPLQRLPTSPLLQDQHMMKMAEWDTRSTTDVSGVPHRAQSSSTLQSYYDSSKSPLYISQQTSASSARDMALRKGYPSITGPAPKVSDVTGAPKSQIGEGTVKSKKRPKQLNLQLDLPSPLPKPDGPVQPVLSPNNIVRSPSPASITSGHHVPVQVQDTRSRWFLWDRKKSKESFAGRPGGAQDFPRPDENNQAGQDASSRKPTKVSEKHRHGVSAESARPGDLSPRPLSQNFEIPVKMARNGKPRRHRLRRSKSSISELHEDLQPTGPDKTREDSTPWPIDTLHDPQRLEEPRVASDGEGQRSGHRAKKSLTMIFSNINIHEHSFLVLSSSDEEDEGRKMTDALSRRHRIRASVDKADTGEEVIVCSAQRLTHVKPRPVVNLPRRRMSRFQGSDPIPPVPPIPARPPLNPRISSMRWREEAHHFLPSVERRSTPEHSRESSRTGRSGFRVSPSGSQRMAPSYENKMMSVTAEEENLLEAMRRKRASIRQEALPDHSDDFSLLQRNIKSYLRPQTAGCDGLSEMSYYSREGSVSPSLASGPADGLQRLSYPASADNIFRDEAYMLGLTPSLVKIPTGSFPDGPQRVSTTFSDSDKSNPHLSFNPSDILPSTPAMSDATGDEMHGAGPQVDCASPMTPPPGHGLLEIYESEVEVQVLPSQSEPILVMGHRGPDPKRTASNQVIVLDGTGRGGRELEDENGMAGWPLDRW